MNTYVIECKNIKVQVLKLLKTLGYKMSSCEINPEKDGLSYLDHLIVATSDKSCVWTNSNTIQGCISVGIGEFIIALFSKIPVIKGTLGIYQYEISKTGVEIGCQSFTNEEIEQFIKFCNENNNDEGYKYQMEVGKLDFPLVPFFKKFGFEREDALNFTWVWFDFINRQMTGNGCYSSYKTTISLEEFIKLALDNSGKSIKINGFTIILNQGKGTGITVKDAKGGLVFTLSKCELSTFISNYKSIAK